MLNAMFAGRRDRRSDDHARRLLHEQHQPGHRRSLGAGPDARVLQHSGHHRHPVRDDDPARSSWIRRPCSRSSSAGSRSPFWDPETTPIPCTPVPPDQGCAAAAGFARDAAGIDAARSGGRDPGGGWRDRAATSARHLHPAVDARAGASCSIRTTSTLIESTIVAYNQAIAAAAAANGAILVDSNALFAQVSRNGYSHRRHPSLDGVRRRAGSSPTTASTRAPSRLRNHRRRLHPDPQRGQKGPTSLVPVSRTSSSRPNVPDIVSSGATTDGGPWHYSLDTWKGFLNAGLARRFAIVMPTSRGAARDAAPAVRARTAPARRASRHRLTVPRRASAPESPGGTGAFPGRGRFC